MKKMKESMVWFDLVFVGEGCMMMCIMVILFVVFLNGVLYWVMVLLFFKILFELISFILFIFFGMIVLFMYKNEYLNEVDYYIMKILFFYF